MSHNTLLETLRAKLRRGLPPSLSSLVQFFSSTEEYLEWVRIVRELLPEREVEILSEASPPEQIAKFISYFQTRYFPLEDSFAWDTEDLTYWDFLRCIPVQLSGIDYDAYHEMDNWRPGMQLMTYLYRNPWNDDDDGARVALAELCVASVSQELLQSVEEGGMPFEFVEQRLKGTRFNAVFRWGEYLCSNTGNFFLDTDYEYLYAGYGSIDWEKDTIDELTREWLQHEQFWNEFVDISVWLEEDPENHFKELIQFITQGEKMNDE